MNNVQTHRRKMATRFMEAMIPTAAKVIMIKHNASPSPRKMAQFAVRCMIELEKELQKEADHER